MFNEFLQPQHPVQLCRVSSQRGRAAAQRGFAYSPLDPPPPELLSCILAASSTKTSWLKGTRTGSPTEGQTHSHDRGRSAATCPS